MSFKRRKKDPASSSKVKHEKRPGIFVQIMAKQTCGKPLNKTETKVWAEIQDTKAEATQTTDGVITITVWKIPPALNERDGMHWSKKAMTLGVWDGIMKYALAKIGPKPLPYPVLIEYQLYKNRLLDADNAASGLKAIIDGLRHCGLLVDDNPQYVRQIILPEQIPVKKIDQHVVLKIYPYPLDKEVTWTMTTKKSTPPAEKPKRTKKS